MRPTNQLPHMNDIAGIFTTDFKLDSGLKVRASLSTPRSAASSDYTTPRRVLQVSRNSPIVPGSILIGADSRHYLCMDNGVEDREIVDYKKFKAVELPYIVDVKRKTTVTDPISKRSVEDTNAVVKSALYCLIEPLKEMTDTLRVATKRYKIITNYQLLAGDTLDSDEFGHLKIHKVDPQLGIFISETG